MDTGINFYDVMILSILFYCLFLVSDGMFLSFFFTRKPAVIMIVGVNGGGKTTSLGKISDCNEVSFI